MVHSNNAGQFTVHAIAEYVTAYPVSETFTQAVGEAAQLGMAGSTVGGEGEGTPGMIPLPAAASLDDGPAAPSAIVSEPATEVANTAVSMVSLDEPRDPAVEEGSTAKVSLRARLARAASQAEARRDVRAEQCGLTGMSGSPSGRHVPMTGPLASALPTVPFSVMATVDAIRKTVIWE